MIPEDKPILLKGCQIYSEQTIIEDGYIKISNQKIEEVGSMNNLQHEEGYKAITFPSDFKAVPGFIDVHIHGVNGADIMDATKDALDTMVQALPKEGTTGFLATTITQEESLIESAILNVAKYIEAKQAPGTAEILGIHLEGPFVNAEKAGAQPEQYIIDPDLEVFNKWQSMTKGSIKMVTLAPERPGGLEMIRYLAGHGVIASIGHTNATYEETIQAMNAGANHVTHLFNQMRGLHHREPGVVGAALLHDQLVAEIIADGVHVRPEAVDLAYRMKGKDGLILITDSMRAKCLKNGHYDLGGQDVIVKDGKAVLQDGTLAGSVLKLGSAVKNMMDFTGCTLEEVIEMASATPAKQLNLFDRKGSIADGKDADIVVLNKDLEVVMTLCRGSVAFDQQEKSSARH